MASSSLKRLLSLLFLSLSSLSSVSQPQTPPLPPSQSLLNAADTLASSGYTAMSLTLQLVAPTLPLPSAAITTLTIFSPPDAAFYSAGQPSLSHLLLHFSPLSLSPASLLSLPFASTVPSLSPSKHLVITSNQTKAISINNVAISESPIFDDGFVIVYAVDSFFDSNFTLAVADPTRASPKSNIQCLELETASRFEEASGVLKSRGYSIIASFLDLQLIGFFGPADNAMKWTAFAPVDGELVQFSGDFLGYFSLFMRHMAPCKVGWSDLEEMANGTVISSNVNGFGLEITRDGDDKMVMVNGVEITFPDLYESEWLVIHGIRGVITLPEIENEEMEFMKDFPDEEVVGSMGPDDGEH